MTEQRIGILGLGAYLPERVMSNAEWSQYVDTSDEWITTRTGIKNRRIAAENETTVDLAAAAARVALEDAGITIDAIDEIIVATDTPEVKIPDTASYLQNVLGAREIPAFDLAGSGCAGFVLGLDVARSRAMTGDKKVLLVGVEMLTRLVSWNDRTTAVLFGDAAGAAIVGAVDGTSEFLAFTAGTDGSRADILTLETGGTRAPFTIEAAQRGDHKNLVMNGREVFKEAVSRMEQLRERSSPTPTSTPRTSPSWCRTRRICGSSTPSRSRSASLTTSCSSMSRTTATPDRHRFRWPSGRRVDTAGSSPAIWCCSPPLAPVSTGLRCSCGSSLHFRPGRKCRVKG